MKRDLSIVYATMIAMLAAGSTINAWIVHHSLYIAWNAFYPYFSGALAMFLLSESRGGK